MLTTFRGAYAGKKHSLRIYANAESKKETLQISDLLIFSIQHDISCSKLFFVFFLNFFAYNQGALSESIVAEYYNITCRTHSSFSCIFSGRREPHCGSRRPCAVRSISIEVIPQYDFDAIVAKGSADNS